MAFKKIPLTIDTMIRNPVPIEGINQEDNVELNIVVTENKTPKDLSSQTIKVYVRRIDGTLVEQTDQITPTNASKGEVTVKLKNSAFNKEGYALFQLDVSDSIGRITSSYATFKIGKGLVSGEAIANTNEIEALKKVEEYIKKANLEFPKYEEKINEFNKKTEEYKNEIVGYQGQVKEFQNATDSLQTQFDEAVANITNGVESATNSEIVQARGGEVNLNRRLDKFDSQLEHNTSKINDICVNVLEHGVKNDGVTDNSDIINNLLQTNSVLYFPKGNYKIKKPIHINRQNITIYGEGDIANSYSKILCEGCSAFFINVNDRYVNISNFQLINTGVKDNTSGLMFGKQNNDEEGYQVHFSNFENLRIDNFENGISIGINKDLSIANTFILWNVFFNKIRIDRCTNGILTNISDGNSFGVVFEKVYCNECDKPLILKSIQANFRDCNFGLKSINSINLSVNSYVVFDGCNFECDYQIEKSGSIIKVNGKSYKFINCIFALQCNANSFMFGVDSDLYSLTLDNCKQMPKTGNVETRLFSNTECGCKNYAIKINGGFGISAPSFPTAYANKYIFNNNMPIIRDNCEYDNVNGNYNFNVNRMRPEINYNGNIYDFLGNLKDSSFPVKVGNKYLDSGNVTISENGIATITYNRKVKGKVFISQPPLTNIKNDIIIIRQDLSEGNDTNTTAVIRCIRWDSVNSTWVNNLNSPITVQWFKISE